MIRIGTAGWHYSDWNGTVYPQPRPRGFDPLVMLSHLFDTIEINVTFYRTPDPSMTRTWVRRVADRPGFRFTAKLPRSFTHAAATRAARSGPRGAPEAGDDRPGAEAPARRSGAARGGERAPSPEARSSRRRGESPGRPSVAEPNPPVRLEGRLDLDDEERRFREAMAPLRDADRLGAVLIQFPQSFHAGREEAAHLEAILERFADLPLVAEFRHAGWEREDAVDLLRRRGAGFCNIDQPRLGSTLRPTSLVTGPVAYVRLHGRNASEWFRGGARRSAGDDGVATEEDASGRPSGSARRYDYLYSPRELAPWIATIERIAEQGADTYVITNNHFRGKAAVNALQIRAALEGGRVEVPDTLLRCYPELSAIEKPPPDRLPF